MKSPKTTPPCLAILIVNWNSKEYVRTCLHKIEENCPDVASQIVVVDGGSFDGCDKMINDEFPKVTFVQSPENVGFGRSNNLGFHQKVTSEYVLLLNPDTEVEKGAIESLLVELQQQENAGATGAYLLNSDGSLQTSSVQPLPTPINQALGSNFLIKLFPNSKLWSLNNAYERSTPTPVQALSGACILLKSDLFREIGGFTPDYFMYAEDMDLCAKIGRAGHKLYHVPNAKIVHHGGGCTQNQASVFSEIMKRDALHLYMHLIHNSAWAFRYRAFQLLSNILRIPLLLIICLLHPSDNSRNSLKKWYHIMIWAGGGNRWAKTTRITSLQKT